MIEPIDKRLWSKVCVKGIGECWEYKERLNEHGYGVFHVKKKSILAHRMAYIITFGVNIDGMIIMHTCDNPRCCNPSHLKIGIQSDNVKDMINKGRNVVLAGSKHYKSKLTEADVINIRKYYDSGQMKVKELSEKYKVNMNNIDFIIKRKTWKHI